MKKPLLFAVFLLLCKLSFAQSPGIEVMPKTYSDTVSITASKSELYLRANEYFSKTTDTLRNEVQFKDQELGKIISKSISIQNYDLGGKGMIKMKFIVIYSTAISVKDNKYKYVISDIFYDKDNVTPKTANEIIMSAIEVLKRCMNTKSDSDF